MKIKSILSALLLMVSSMASAQKYLNVKLEDGTYRSFKATPNMEISFDKTAKQEKGSGNTIVVNGYVVTVKLSDDVADAGIADDLIVQCKSDGESVIIESYSKNTVKSLVVRINDGSLIAPAENGRINTFTISDITKDITATLAYAKK